eukprot:c23776_g1_i1 orf=978-2066(-)
MATIATSLLHPSTTISRSWDARPSLTCSHNFAVDFREFTLIKHRKALLQLARASSVKGNTRKVEEEAEEVGLKISSLEERDPSDGPTHVDLKAKRAQDADSAYLAQPNVGKDQVSPEDSEGENGLLSGDTAVKGSIAAGLLLVGVIGGFGAASYVYKDQINDFLLKFSDFIEGNGAAGYALFVAGYAGLEILAIPAIPLTMSAGLLFGTVMGTILVSISGTIAATLAFLIARYVARDRILKFAEGNKKFLAIDKAIGENGFRVVALLRLSPLLPLSLSNYIYGLTSVDILPYVLGSWLGMLPGTWAYVSAGAVGRAFIQQEAEDGMSGGSEHLWTLGIGLLVTVIAATYVTRLAKDAIKDIE